MNIKWRITEVNKSTGSIVVNFFEETLMPMGVFFNFDLPIVNGALPSEEEVKKIVNAQIPSYIFERIVTLQSAIDATSVEGMIGIVHNAEPPSFTNANAEFVIQPTNTGTVEVENV